MSGRGVVVDDATGAILRTVTAPPEMLAANVTTGESLFVLTEDGGAWIDDANLIVSETGVLEPSPTAPEGTTAPAHELQYVAI